MISWNCAIGACAAASPIASLVPSHVSLKLSKTVLWQRTDALLEYEGPP